MVQSTGFVLRATTLFATANTQALLMTGRGMLGPQTYTPSTRLHSFSRNLNLYVATARQLLPKSCRQCLGKMQHARSFSISGAPQLRPFHAREIRIIGY